MQKTTIKSIIAQNLYIARKCAGLNHVELVNISGVTRPIISGIENASANPTFDTMIKLSSVLGINIEMLLFGKERFDGLYKIFKNRADQAFQGEKEIVYPDKILDSLLRLSLKQEKRNYKKIAFHCRRILNLNFPSLPDQLKNRMLYSGVQGIIFSEYGFKQGFEFGIWLCINMFSDVVE